MKPIYFGADYYPEHWPRERWETDARLMEEMGLDLVRMAEFSWAKMEPRLGEFHFEWLDEAIEILAGRGIETLLGTPTAAPPAWIVEETPEIFPMDAQGVRHGFGGRHHDCQSNPVYRAHIRRFVSAMAEHFKENPHVIGWQIDNELGNSHKELCMCPCCTRRFQEWLREKYGDIGTLNREWGAAFWSQQYDSFGQISAPRVTVTGRNPSAALDWKRFCSDLIVEFMQFQADILRKICPGKLITHNCMGFADKVNYFKLGKSLDFVCQDQYPGGFFGPQPSQSPARLAAELDIIRAAKGRSFWVMEQQAGITGWEIMGRAPRPGQLSLWATQSVAHGADAVVFFRWRTCAMGTEQYWHGILPHSGRPGRRYEELGRMVHKLRPLMEKLQGSVPRPQVGIVFSYEQEYAMQIQPHHPDLDYLDQVMRYYQSFYRRNIPVDFTAQDGDWSGYRLLVAPLQYLMSPRLAEKYEEYVKNGGHLVLTMRAGVKTENNLCVTDKELPGELGKLTGITISDYDCLRDTLIAVRWGEEEFTAGKWADIIEPESAKPLAAFASEFYQGHPAVTVNAFGNGLAYYVGTEPEARLMDRLCGELTERSGVRPLCRAPEGVEAVCRSGEDGDYLFLLNHTEHEQGVKIPEGFLPLEGGQEETLPPYGTGVWRRPKKR